jgi:hypothetical protein
MPSTPSSRPSTPYETFCSKLRNIDIFQGLFDFLDLSRSHFALRIEECGVLNLLGQIDQFNLYF